jgi:hypothetical protein
LLNYAHIDLLNFAAIFENIMTEGSPKKRNIEEEQSVTLGLDESSKKRVRIGEGSAESLWSLSLEQLVPEMGEMRNSPLLKDRRRRIEDGLGDLPEHLQEEVFARFRLDRVKEDLGLRSSKEGEVTLYRSGNFQSAWGETLGVFALHPGIYFREIFREKCNFSEDQMRNWVTDITESQLTKMAGAIAESGQPLKYSRNEEELLHEVDLATGVKASSLDEITAARFDADAAKGKYSDYSSLRGDYRLLRVPAIDGGFLSVSINRDIKRGEDALKYTLKPISNSYTYLTLDDASKIFVNTVEYCSGKGASKDIQYFESQPLIK